MGAVAEGHALDRVGDVDERHPHRDGVVGVQRPIELILVPRRRSPTGLLEERLVVVEPNAVDTEQRSSDRREPWCEGEARDRGIVLPQVRGLDERLAVRVALVDRPTIPTNPFRGLLDRGTEPVDLGA